MRRRKLIACPGGRDAQHVADAAHRVQQARLVADLGLAAQVADVDAERVRAGAEVIAPDVLEDRRARQHLAGVAQEHLEQQELGAGEREQPLAAPRLVGARVQAQVLEDELAVAVLVLLAARRSSARTRASSSRSANGLTR